MKREKKSSVSVSIFILFLCVLLLFSQQSPVAVSLFNSENSGDDGNSQTVSTAEISAEAADGGSENDDDISADALSVDASSDENSVSDAQIDAGNTSAEDLPDADDILPDSTHGGTEINEDPASESEREGTSVIPIEVNTIIRDILPSESSINTYTFTLTERGALAYAFTHVTSTGDTCSWEITLFEEYSPDGTGNTVAYREINSITYSAVGEEVSSPVTGLLPGNYRISVECYSGYTSEKFDFAVGFSASEAYETEYNNSQSRYTYLPLNKTLTGSASSYRDGSADADWYMFEITEEGYAAVYFTHGADTSDNVSSSSVAWRIVVTDVEGNEYYYTSSSMEAESLNSGVMGLTEGYYFITVYSHVVSGVSYDISVAFSEDAQIERELNDTPETATPIEVNTQMIGSLTERYEKSDTDYYSFTIESDGFIVLQFLHEALSESNDGWNIQVITESGDTIYSTISDWSQGTLQSPYIGIAAGTYYIKVDSDNIYRNSMVYRLILLTTGDDTWETEPNDTPETADTLEFNETVYGAMIDLGVDFDKDYYAIEIDEPGVVTVSFSHIVSDGSKHGWTVSLLDEDLNVVRTLSSNWDDSQKSFVFKTEDTGSYYILVETGLYFNSSRYSLTVTHN
ncbi:MAG: hypothetical protein LUH40_04705 [Clostridiales bacterium]|nr:hypothetical protein [Clostridiales bacterium]